VRSSESKVDGTKPDAVPPVGKIALEEHFVLAETNEDCPATWVQEKLTPRTCSIFRADPVWWRFLG
jgi:hypothetical protein